MWRFLLGLLVGVLLAGSYVKWNLELPAFLTLPSTLRGNVVSSTAESELYDLAKDDDVRQRALEVFFANRARFAATIDREAGHPFRSALYRQRAVREASALRQEWSGFDAVLAKEGLRAALERKYETTDTKTLRIQMLVDGLDRYAFLKSWLAAGPATIAPPQLIDVLTCVVRLGQTEGRHGAVENCVPR